MSTNQYQEMRNRQQAEANAFPMSLLLINSSLLKECASWACPPRTPARYAAFLEAATAVKAMSQN